MPPLRPNHRSSFNTMTAIMLQHSPATLNKAESQFKHGVVVSVQDCASREDVKQDTATVHGHDRHLVSTQPGLPAINPPLAAAPKMDSSTLSDPSILPALSPPCNGPNAASYSVPPRPKPGRKPALDKPSEKRKAQNREAQRAFRERKVAHTEELRKELDQMKESYDDVVKENGSLKRKLHEMQASHKLVEEQSQRREQLLLQLQDRVRRYHEEEERWTRLERMHTDAQQRLKEYEESSRSQVTLRRPSSTTLRRLPDDTGLASIQQHRPLTPPQHSPVHEDSSCGDCAQTGYCKCVDDFTVDLAADDPVSTGLATANVATPSFDELEMDFTSGAAPNPAPTGDLSKKSPKPGCGLCEGPTDCLCQTNLTTEASPPVSRPRRADPMQISSIVEPGTCLKCQEDPEQRRFCIEASRTRQISLDLPDRSSNKRPRLDDGRPRTMTCNELYQASKHVVAESRRTGRSKPAEMETMFNAYTKAEIRDDRKTEARPGMRYRTYSTLEIDGIEALAGLSRTLKP